VSALSNTDYNIPLTYAWNLTVSHRLPGHSLLEVAYVGNDSEHTLMGGQSGAALQNGDFINQNKTPLGALFKPDPITGIVAPNPEDVTHDLAGTPIANTYADYHPFGVYLGPGALHGEQIYGTNSIYVADARGLFELSTACKPAGSSRAGRSPSISTSPGRRPWVPILGKTRSLCAVTMGPKGLTIPTSSTVPTLIICRNLLTATKCSPAPPTDGPSPESRTGKRAAICRQSTMSNGPNFGLGVQYTNYPSTLPSGNALSQKTYYGTDSSNLFTIQPDLTCNPA
jgi:hypothetical protein